jgi:hypothetical protein
MCPECFAAIALLVTGVVSTGGATAATVKLLRNKRTAAKISEARKPELHNSKEKSQ